MTLGAWRVSVVGTLRAEMKQTLLTRLRERLGRYMHDVQRSRVELSEGTQERALPPIPPGDHHGQEGSAFPVTVPEGSCAGTGGHPTAGSISQECAKRRSGLCRVCGGASGSVPTLGYPTTSPPRLRADSSRALGHRFPAPGNRDFSTGLHVMLITLGVGSPCRDKEEVVLAGGHCRGSGHPGCGARRGVHAGQRR